MLPPPLPPNRSRRQDRFRTAVACSSKQIVATFIQYLHVVQIADSLFLEGFHHGLEHVERFFLVFDKRIVLSVATKPDTFLEVIHRQKVIFPELVEHAQHDHAFVMAHRLRADDPFLRIVTVNKFVEDRVAEFLTIQRVWLSPSARMSTPNRL